MYDRNLYLASTSPEKLRGRYYTPPDLVRLILEQVAPTSRDLLFDPSCGDGEFLVGAVRYLASRVEGGGRKDLGEALARHLVGMDVNQEAVSAARARVQEALRAWFGVSVAQERLRIFCGSSLDCATRESLFRLLPADLHGAEGRLLVVGNPPYVEAKRLAPDVKAALKARFPEASAGASDLYLYFLHASLGWLHDRDELALVLPNKALVNANGREVRRALRAGNRLRGIDFATTAGVFPDAAVYPVVLYASAAEGVESGSVALSRIERCGDHLRRLTLPPAERDAYGSTESLAFFPTPASPLLAEALLALVRQVRDGRLGDVLDIRWTVSFHRRGLRERYVTQSQPDGPRARRFLGGGAFAGNGDVVRYACRWSGWWMDYDTERLRRDGNPLPDPALFEPPKVIICQNGRTLRAAYDEAGYVLKDTLLCGLPLQGSGPLSAHPRALVGLLCSRAAHFFYSHVFHGGHVNGGYLHFLRSFLVDVPLGHWIEAAAREAERLVRLRERASAPEEQRELEEGIEALVEDAFQLPPEHRAALREWAQADGNWTMRDRVRSSRGIPP